MRGGNRLKSIGSGGKCPKHLQKRTLLCRVELLEQCNKLGFRRSGAAGICFRNNTSSVTRGLCLVLTCGNGAEDLKESLLLFRREAAEAGEKFMLRSRERIAGRGDDSIPVCMHICSVIVLESCIQKYGIGPGKPGTERRIHAVDEGLEILGEIVNLVTEFLKSCVYGVLWRKNVLECDEGVSCVPNQLADRYTQVVGQ